MKKLQRTTMTWRFVNSMAPAHTNYMPTKVCDAKLVEVTAAMFRGKATMMIIFEAEKFAREVHQFVIRNRFALAFHEVRDALGTQFDNGNDPDCTMTPVWANGSCLWVNLKFDLRSGECFTHAAIQKFVKLVTLIGQEEWRGRYFLPTPHVVQETMIEAYCDGNWVTYGDYLYDAFQPEDPLAPKSDLLKEIEKDREARARAMGN